MSDGRTRNWSFIGYPESLEIGWMDTLSQMGIQAIISPLHDKDLQDDGQPKKAHYHIILIFDSVKSYEQVKEITDKVKGTIPQRVMNLRGSVRYLTHKDSISKAHYKDEDIISIGGVDVNKLLRTNEDEEKDVVSQMGKIFNLCVEKSLFEFCDVAEFLITEEPELFSVFRKNAYFFSQFIRSKSVNRDFTKNTPCQK